MQRFIFGFYPANPPNSPVKGRLRGVYDAEFLEKIVELIYK